MRPVPPARSPVLLPGLLAIALAACGSERREPPPNAYGVRHVVLVSIDTLRADRLGCYGFQIEGRSPSPNLDRLAAEGVTVVNHFSAAPTTLAAHTSLMTGTYPHTHGILRNGYEVNPGNVMLAEVLRDAGFFTSAFVGAAPLTKTVGFDQGFLQYDFSYSKKVGSSPSGYQRRADEVTDAALDWLDERYAGDVDEPLFLFVHYFDVHAPYEAPEPYRGMYQQGRPPRGINTQEAVNDVRKKLVLDGMTGKGEPEDAVFDEDFLARAASTRPDGMAFGHALEAEYCAEITFTDHELERLLEGLRERGVLDQALVLVTADHGETFYEHTAVFSHGETVFDSEIKTPLILHFPGGRFAGTRLERLASSVDVVPTLLAVLGLSAPERVEGESFLGALEGTLPPRGPVFAEATKPWRDERYESDPVWPNRGKFQAARTLDRKLVLRDPDDQRRLYDVVADPLEQHSLLGTPQAEPEASDLEAALRAWMERARPFPSALVESDEQKDALEALGYGGGG